MTSQLRRFGALVLAAGLLVTGCTKSDGKAASDVKAKTTTTSKDAKHDKITPRTPVGTATVVVGDSTWRFDVTACVVAKDRVTAQGDDRKGRTVVATFARSSKRGSITVSSPTDIWALGPAAGTKVEGAKVSPSRLAGRGTFGHQQVGKAATGDKPVSVKADGKKAEGRFEVVCDG